MAKLIGLTGGIAAGKSAVAALLRARGIPVLDADAISREILRPGEPAHADVAREWPTVITADGTIDRKALGRIVFADPTARAKLEAISHPRIRARVAEETRRLGEQGHALVFLEAALLVETGFYRQLDGLVVVTAPVPVQRARLLARDQMTPEEADARLAAQLPPGQKTAVAHHVIDNGGPLAQTASQVDVMLRQLA
jgi:dephospho-CoA kinase